jgi:hypothetical protein
LATTPDELFPNVGIDVIKVDTDGFDGQKGGLHRVCGVLRPSISYPKDSVPELGQT